MTNKRFKHIAEVQRDVDYIIKMSNVLETTSSGTLAHEETHLNVDIILAEPLERVKYQSKIEKELREIRQAAIKNESNILLFKSPQMPKREKLIVHEHIGEKKRHPIARNLTHLFRSYSY